MTILKVVFYLLGACAFVSLAVYAWLANRGDSRTLHSTIDHRITSTRTSVFVGFAAIAFLVCMYQGAEAVLAWMPDSWGRVGEDGEYQRFSGLLAAAFALLVGGALARVIDSATRNAFFLREVSEENTHLKKLLDASLDNRWLEELKRDFKERIAKLEPERRRRDGLPRDDLEPPRAHLWPEGERILQYHDLIALAERQQDRLRQAAEQVRHTVAAALKEESAKRDSAKALEAHETALARQGAAAAQRRQQAQRFVSALASAHQLPVAQAANGIARGQFYLVDPALVEKRWKALDSVSIPQLAITKNDIRRGETTPRSIDSILGACAGTSVTSAATIVASYSGDAHGGHTEFHALLHGQKLNYLDALRFHDSLDGLIEGLYFAFALRQHGTYWHGLSGRDYTFLFSSEQLAEVLEDRLQWDPNQQSFATIDRPCGVRMLAVADGHCVSCMAASPTGTIVDLSVRIAAGRLTIEPQQEISASNVTMFY